MSHVNLKDYQSEGGNRATTIRRRNSLTPANELSNNVLSTAGSVLKIYCYYSSPDFGQPWQLERSKMSTSSGFVVKWQGKNVIITNAHAVSHANTVQVKRHGASRKYIARILCISDTNDLAVLTCDDPTFWHQLKPLRFAPELPSINEACYVVGFPMGGDEISFTSGVVSRLGVNTFAHSGENWLSIQIDAAINPGNSGGCVVSKSRDSDGFRVVGCAFETMTNANSIGYMIAVPVIINMLESYSTNNIGTPSLNIMTQSIESQAQRDSLYIPPLSGLIDYLYETSGDSSQDLSKLMRNLSAGRCGEEDDDNNYVTNRLNTSSNSSNSSVESDDESSVPTSPTNDRLNMELQSSRTNNDKCPMNPTKMTLSSARFNRRRSLCSSEVYQALHTVVDQDEEYDYVTFNPVMCSEGICSTTSSTPVYRIKRSNKREKAPKQLALYLDPSRVNDTSIGILITDVVPFSKSSRFLEEGDILLSISGVPISSDQTIILRENERVKFTHLISSTHIGDHVTVVISRGFDIITMSIPIEQKQYIAKWSQYNIPSYLCCLGLIMSPLTSNLMECEYGANWADSAPILLLESLFLGTFHRFHEDEEAVVLTQVLSHEITQGYSYTMRRITHINDQRVINLKHCATLIARAIQAYEHHIFVYPPIDHAFSLTPLQSPDSMDFTSDAKISNIPIFHPDQRNVCLLDKHGRRISIPKADEALKHFTTQLPPQNAPKGVIFQSENTSFLSPDDEMSPLTDHSARTSQQLAKTKLPFIQEAHTTHKTDPDDYKYPETPNDDSNRAKMNASHDYSGSGNDSDDERTPLPNKPQQTTFIQPPDLDLNTASGRHQLHLQHLHHQTLHKYLTFTLQNNYKITLSLENGRKHQLEILKSNMIPIPGCSDDIVPPYDIKVNIVGQEALESSPSTTPKESSFLHSNVPVNVNPSSIPDLPSPILQIGHTPRGSRVEIPYAEKLYTPRLQPDSPAPPVTNLPPPVPSPYVLQFSQPHPYVMGKSGGVPLPSQDLPNPIVNDEESDKSHRPHPNHPHPYMMGKSGSGGIVPSTNEIVSPQPQLPLIIDDDSNQSQERQLGTTVSNNPEENQNQSAPAVFQPMASRKAHRAHHPSSRTTHHKNVQDNRSTTQPALGHNNNDDGDVLRELVPEPQRFANQGRIDSRVNHSRVKHLKKRHFDD